MLLLHHPYIVSLKEMVVLDPYYYMFMEYVDGGQLLDFIISHGKLKERLARRFARQIVSALGKSSYCLLECDQVVLVLLTSFFGVCRLQRLLSSQLYSTP
jgi:serine/threonine protein kinase